MKDAVLHDQLDVALELLRRAELMSKQVHAAYLRDGQPRSDQGEVWREPTRKLMGA